MTQACCPSCRLRFTRAAAAHLDACPLCGEPIQAVPSAAHLLGFRLISDDDRSDSLPQAVAVALPDPDPGTTPGG
jgi:predicted amidophosphoribosyltransferase